MEERSPEHGLGGMGGTRMSLFDINPDPEEAFLFNTISSICSDYLYVWDLAGDVLLASPNMVSDLGLAGNRLTNCSQMDINWVHPHDRERVREQYRAFMDSKEDSLNLVYQALTASGSSIWLSGRAKMKRDAVGRPLLIVGTLRNLALELTQTYFTTNDANVNDSLERLNEMHIELSMDDFGTGYSSFGRLSEIGMDDVKNLTAGYDSKNPENSIDRMKFQKKLVNSRELLFAMMNATPLCLMLWNRQSEIMACNEKAVRLFGAEGKEEIIEHFYRFSPLYQADGRSSIELVHEKIAEAFAAGYSEFKWLHCDKDGECIPVEVISVRLPYREDFVVASYTRDLRGEIELEEKRSKFRMRLKALLDATPLCLNLWDKEFHNIMCNREAPKLFGLESEQEYLDHFNRLSPELQPDGSLSIERAKEKIREAMETGRVQFNWLHQKTDGELIPAEITLVRIDGLEEDGSAMVAGYTRDLRDQLRAEKAERLMARRVRAVVDSSPLACVLWNMNQEALDCNQIAVEMLGAADKEEVLHDFDSFMPLYQPDGSVSVEKRKKTMSEIQNNRRNVFEWVYVNRKGESIPCEVTLVKAVIGSEDEDIIIAYSRDLRELKRTMEIIERLKRQACYDALTGCLTREYFIEILGEQLQKGAEAGPVVLGLLDLDGFKNVNDTYGHEAGDMTLKRVMKKVREVLPIDTVVGRFGGDEFLFLLHETKHGIISHMLNCLVEQIPHMQLEYQGNIFTSSISIGAVFQTTKDTCPDDLIRRADDALYQAKRNGRNRSVLIE